MVSNRAAVASHSGSLTIQILGSVCRRRKTTSRPARGASCILFWNLPLIRSHTFELGDGQRSA